MPRQQKVIETTDIMLQMVAAGRGVSALPGWLVEEYADKLAIKAVPLGKSGINKKIFVGIREHDRQTDYICNFIQLCLGKN
jgi:LysR family transcriptional regulator for metE and metH